MPMLLALRGRKNCNNLIKTPQSLNSAVFFLHISYIAYSAICVLLTLFPLFPLFLMFAKILICLRFGEKVQNKRTK